jgi:hypothetical protein
MGSDEKEPTLFDDLKFWLRFIFNHCYNCGKLLLFTPFPECEPCCEARIKQETCPACHEPAYILDESSNVRRCVFCGYA